MKNDTISFRFGQEEQRGTKSFSSCYFRCGIIASRVQRPLGTNGSKGLSEAVLSLRVGFSRKIQWPLLAGLFRILFEGSKRGKPVATLLTQDDENVQDMTE